MNINARIVSMQLDSPSSPGPARTIVAVTPGTVFSESGNLVALSGTVSIPPGSALLAGTGTSFTSQITSECVMKAAGQYLQVGQVISDTQLQIDSSQSAPISGASAQVIRCDLKGKPCQLYGRYIPAGTNTASFSYVNQTSEGNVYGNVYVGDWGIFPLGQEVLMDSGSYPLNTDGNPTLLVPWYVNVFPETWQALGTVAQITADVTGTTGSTLKIAAYNDAGPGQRSVMATFSALTKNTQARGVPSAVFTGLGTSLSLVAVLEGGSDNVPSAGSVRAQLLVRKVAPPPLPAVP